MQNQHLKLREIIWEITGKCNNNCTYCGSKKVSNNFISDENIIKIAEKIAEYPPLEIDISGGDPLTLTISLHAQVVNILKAKNIKCKILCNPKSVRTAKSACFETLKLYDWCGFSVNTKEELSLMRTIFSVSDFDNYTVITNFNISNLYDYDLIEEYVKKHNKLWMVQFTVYEDENNELAVYNNSSALKYLEDKVNNSIQSGVKIILSDNVRNDVPCGAGLCSLGITYNGDVIPCLSMRSWCEPTDGYTLNILETSLEYIWLNSFQKQRFGEFKCCKEACKNKIINIKPQQISVDKLIEQFEKIKSEPKINDITPPFTTMIYSCPSPHNMPNTVLYGVSTPGNTPWTIMVYGVQQDMNMLYGVPDYLNRTNTNFGTNTNLDNTSDDIEKTE